MNIKTEIEKLQDQLNLAQVEVDTIRARIKSIQNNVCKHINSKSFKTGYYDGSTATCFHCKDCGLKTER